MNDCLVVDSTHRPIAYCNWMEAIKLCYEGIADVIKEDAEKEVHSPSVTMKIPRVISIRNYVSKRYKVDRITLTRRNIAIRDDRRCQYCGIELSNEEQTLDHVIPVSKGGKSVWENLVLCCKPCNRDKADRSLEDAFRFDEKTGEETKMVLLRIPTKPSPGVQYKNIGHIRPEWADYQRD
jgi:5-methylcytosine-specific restriction endonuclease McrA